jgi:hypothetical protein
LATTPSKSAQRFILVVQIIEQSELMSLDFLLSFGFALAYLAWIWRDGKADSRVGFIFSLIGSTGILILLTCDYINTLPSHTPLRAITGLATNRSSLFFDHSHSEFILIEEGTGRRILFTTVIDGPWADQPVCATYVDDGRYIPSVVRIEILSDDQFPWHVQKGYAGWVGTAEAKRRAPLTINFIGLVFIVVGAFALANKKSTAQLTDKGNVEKQTVPGE